MIETPSRSRHWCRAGALAVISLVFGCGESVVTQPIVEANPDIRAYVTDSAAASLDANSQFHINADAAPDVESVPVISATYARALAAAYLKTFGPLLLSAWERQRGGPIDLASLTVSSHVYPAETAFGAVPPVGCHPYFLRLLGSYYLMTLDRGGDPQVRLAVSAQLTDYMIDSGYVIDPPRPGQDFLPDGLRADHSIGFLFSPEQAVALVARATGAKVRQVPRFVLRGATDYTPNLALWRLALDRSVTVRRADGSQDSISTVYMSPNQNPRWYVAARNQPTSVTLECERVDQNLVNTGFTSVTVPVINGQPINFEPVSFP